jgi:hypothetical protein
VKTDQDGGEKENGDKDGGLSSSDEDDCSWVKVPSLANAVTDQTSLEGTTEIVELPELPNIGITNLPYSIYFKIFTKLYKVCLRESVKIVPTTQKKFIFISIISWPWFRFQ